ncbi:hypothetical protein [Phaeodactylibacter xiamenensis]|uniref:hypothetical protein n=1 Tax=Phaeodactylibacter xiamenensis TaxID=1524460 RepID=UPI003BACDA3B
MCITPKPLRSEYIPRPVNPDTAVAFRSGLGVLLQLLLRQVDDPSFRDGCDSKAGK